MNSTALQHTIRHDIRFSGIALHEGGIVNVRLAPAAENTGIVFRRTDKVAADIRADCQAVSDTHLATTLSDGNGTSISTVEHLLSALSALSVDNLYVELDGGELPIVDGSAAPWFIYLNACGLSRQTAARRRIHVLQPVSVTAGERQAAWHPPAKNGGSGYDVSIDFPHAVVNRSGRRQHFRLNEDDYERDISRARTFCYVNDVELMHRHNRARGGSLQNAVVYDDEGVINQEGLRYPDEFVRHKILDVIGDCYINGHAVVGDYVGKSPGHDINNQLMRKLINTPDAWEWREEKHD